MLRKIFAQTLFLAAVISVSAQNSKLDLRTQLRLKNGEVKSANAHLLVKGNLAQLKILCEQYGGNFKYGYNNIASVEIPEKNLLAFSENISVVKIEKPVQGKLLMDTARIRNNIDSVHHGYAPLIDSFKGKHVVVGIIDGGIYFQHPDFQKPDGTTRIRYIWDQTISVSNIPVPYNYGNEWSWIDIDNNACSHDEPSDDFGHGTNVAGIACGDGSSVEANPNLAGKYVGVAPESEIIAVRVKSDNDFLAHVADAVDYIFKKADALGRPCVINTSVGTYDGSHDGQDLATQLIEYLLEERNGRVLVAAAGNGGNVPHHLSYNIPSDSAYTFFKFNNYYQDVYWEVWADTFNFNQVQFTIGCNDSLGNNLGRLQYFSIPTNFNPLPKTYTIVLNNGITTLGQVSMQAVLDEGKYHLGFQIVPVNENHLWRLQTRGAGKFDLWSSESLIGSSDMLDSLPTGDTAMPFSYIAYPNYRHADTLKTIVSSWQCSDKVITVANCSNRAGYLDVDSNYFDLTNNLHTECGGIKVMYDEVIGKRFKTSSIGPTRDGRMKPDISATGSTIISTGDAQNIALMAGGCNRFKVGLGGQHSRNGGTSMASPIVAGIVALYLEKRPTATWNEVKLVLENTAKRDVFTGSTANNFYGYGKVNAFRALVSNLSFITFGAMDTVCINYNPLANVDSGNCVQKVYGCTDSAADNYNPLANVSDGSCTYTAIKNIGDEKISVSVIPNPSHGSFQFTVFGLQLNEDAQLEITDVTGKIVFKSEIRNQKSEIRTSLSTGIYFYSLIADSKKIKSGKIFVE